MKNPRRSVPEPGCTPVPRLARAGNAHRRLPRLNTVRVQVDDLEQAA
jgi:hypothetical protein